MIEIKELYLAHPFDIRHEVRKRELQFEKETGIELLNPFYDTGREDIKLLDSGKIRPRTMKTKEQGLAIVDDDLELISGCEGILSILDKGACMIGTPMEIFYNSKIIKHPTYIITKNLGGHPWIIALSDKIFSNWDEFTKYIMIENDNRER